MTDQKPETNDIPDLPPDDLIVRVEQALATYKASRVELDRILTVLSASTSQADELIKFWRPALTSLAAKQVQAEQSRTVALVEALGKMFQAQSRANCAIRTMIPDDGDWSVVRKAVASFGLPEGEPVEAMTAEEVDRVIGIIDRALAPRTTEPTPQARPGRMPKATVVHMALAVMEDLLPKPKIKTSYLLERVMRRMVMDWTRDRARSVVRWMVTRGWIRKTATREWVLTREGIEVAATMAMDFRDISKAVWTTIPNGHRIIWLAQLNGRVVTGDLAVIAPRRFTTQELPVLVERIVAFGFLQATEPGTWANTQLLSQANNPVRRQGVYRVVMTSPMMTTEKIVQETGYSTDGVASTLSLLRCLGVVNVDAAGHWWAMPRESTEGSLPIESSAGDFTGVAQHFVSLLRKHHRVDEVAFADMSWPRLPRRDQGRRFAEFVHGFVLHGFIEQSDDPLVWFPTERFAEASNFELRRDVERVLRDGKEHSLDAIVQAVGSGLTSTIEEVRPEIVSVLRFWEVMGSLTSIVKDHTVYWVMTDDRILKNANRG